jgi:hypothetical protein
LRKSKINIIETLVGVVLLVFAISFGFGLIGGDQYVRIVKSGTLEAYPQKTVGKAFDDFLSNPRWESGLSDEGERFVNVRGEVLYIDEEVELAVQFIIDKDNKTFSYNASEINGVPQNNLVFWNLLETIYNADPASTVSSSREASRSNSNTASNSRRIVVGETQSFDVNGFGNLEVTLDYVEFIDRIKHPPLGNYNIPDSFPYEGSIFLRATLTLRNIGTKRTDLVAAWNKIVYDGTFEFMYHTADDNLLSDINPLTPPTTGAIVFMVPKSVAESDKSLVLNYFYGGYDMVMSFVIRPGARGGQAEQA